jgi:hypothetical protein
VSSTSLSSSPGFKYKGLKNDKLIHSWIWWGNVLLHYLDFFFVNLLTPWEQTLWNISFVWPLWDPERVIKVVYVSSCVNHEPKLLYIIVDCCNPTSILQVICIALKKICFEWKFCCHMSQYEQYFLLNLMPGCCHFQIGEVNFNFRLRFNLNCYEAISTVGTIDVMMLLTPFNVSFWSSILQLVLQTVCTLKIVYLFFIYDRYFK